MTAAPAPPKAFAVWFSHLYRWDPTSFHRISWGWPKNIMRPIGSFLRPRKEKVNRVKYRFSDLQPITIHFDGSVDKRTVDPDREYTMELYFARPGDIVVAKIDLKNGAVAIVPDWKNVAVTNHFAVYEPDRSKVLPAYFHRVIQTGSFKEHLWRNKVGAEGRKEVKLEFFEAQEVPLPPLTVQEKIVAHWGAAQDAINKSSETVSKLEQEITDGVSKTLGLNLSPKQIILPKALGLWWNDIVRWGVSFNRDPLSPKTLLNSKNFPAVELIDIAFVNPPTKITVNSEELVTFVPMEAISDVDGEIVTPKHLPFSRVAKGYTKFQENDVIWAKITPCMQNGKSAVARNLKGGIGFGSTEFHVIRSRDQQAVLPDYIWIILRSELVRKLAVKYFVGSAGQQRVPAEFLEDLVIPIPQRNIQQEITNTVRYQRRRIAEERKSVEKRRSEVVRDLEEMILGIRPVPQ